MRTIQILSAATILWAAPAGAATTRVPDAGLEARVTQRLRDANFDSIYVKVSNGTVALTGAVDRLSKAERARKIADRTGGVEAVDNRIEVVSERTDEQIARDLTHEIRVFPFYDIFDQVEGEVGEGVVTLRGAVRLPQRFHDYANLAKQVGGVKTVVNQLEVLPTSSYDDQIRLRVARAIYGSSALGTRYGNQARPPIHILVKNGNVRLEGVVLNQLDKQLVERAARFAATYFALENNLKVERS